MSILNLRKSLQGMFASDASNASSRYCLHACNRYGRQSEFLGSLVSQTNEMNAYKSTN